MAPAPTRDDPYASLQSLNRAAQNTSHPPPDLPLPDRSRLPSSEPGAATNAIVFIAQHTEHLYHKQDSSFVEIVAVKHAVDRVDQKVNHFESGVKGALTSLADRLDGVEDRLDGVENRLDRVEVRLDGVERRLDRVEQNLGELRTQVKNVETQLSTLQKEAKSFQTVLCNTNAMQLNSFRRYLNDPIHPILPWAIGANPQLSQYFPKFLRDFWALRTNITALTHLAQQYELLGWEQWQRSASYDTDATDFLRLEDAVAMCPERCLQALAGMWGLQYHQLEEPRAPTKRKADSDASAQSRRRRKVEFDDVVESIFSQDDDGVFTRQDRNIQTGPRRRLTATASEISFTDVLARYPNPPGHLGVSFESAQIQYRARSSTQSDNPPPTSPS